MITNTLRRKSTKKGAEAAHFDHFFPSQIHDPSNLLIFLASSKFTQVTTELTDKIEIH